MLMIVDYQRNREPIQQPKVSIVVPTFNRASVLREGLLSYQKQSLTEFEVIVVDNGPSDDATRTESLAFVHSDPRFSYIATDQKGLAFARNLGCHHSKAEIIVTTDDDFEMVDSETLKLIVGRFESDPKVGVLGVRAIEEQAYGRESKRAKLCRVIHRMGLLWPGTITRWGRVDGHHYLLPNGSIADVDHVRGFCLAFRRNIAREFGFFATIYVNHGDDFRSETEFCCKFRARGFKVQIACRCQGSHKGAPRQKGVVTRRITPQKLHHLAKNHTLFILRNFWSKRSGWIFMLWDVSVGTAASQPGFLRLLFSLRHFGRFKLVMASIRGKLDGYSLYLKDGWKPDSLG